MMKNSVNKASVIPIYYQIAQYFHNLIGQNKLLPGQAIPTENEICMMFGVSRMTVRRAISELVAEGMVYAQKGKGTFVSKPRLDNDGFNLNDFYKEMIQKGMQPQTKLLEVKIVKADDVLAEKLKIEHNTRCLFFRILITANDEPLVYEVKYTVYEKQKPILESELKDPSLSNLAAMHTDSLPSTSKRTLMVATTTEEEARILGVQADMPVFLMEQFIFDFNKRPIAWGKSIFRGDRYKLTSYDGWDVSNEN